MRLYEIAFRNSCWTQTKLPYVDKIDAALLVQYLVSSFIHKSAQPTRQTTTF
jgi:hypothetical protein